MGILKKIRITGKVAALDGVARTLGMFQDGPSVGVGLSIHLHLGETR